MNKNYTVKEFAKKLRVSEGHIYELVKRGEIAKVNSIGRVIRIPSSELNKITNKKTFSYNPIKVKVIETNQGKFRKIRDTGEYVLIDITRAIGVSDSCVISKTIKGKHIRKLSIEEAHAYGFFSTRYGLSLISDDGIKEYSGKTRNKGKIDVLIRELGVANEVVKETSQNQVAENQIGFKIFEGHEVEIINVNGQVLFELYSTGVALGQVKISKGLVYPRKERIDKSIENAEIKPVVHNGQQYLTEEMLYDLMLEMKTDKVKPFRKWITNEVLPTINHTGGYIANAPKFINNYFSNFSIELRHEMIDELKIKIDQLSVEKEKIDSQLLESVKAVDEIRSTL
ncbi:helix-turn-helix domain-containing protein [Clostridium sporogenes]